MKISSSGAGNLKQRKLGQDSRHTSNKRAHKEWRKAITTAGQGGYNVAINSIYGIPTNKEQAAQFLELQERAAESLETISDGLSTHQDSISDLTQANAVLSTNTTTLAAQMAQMMQQMQTLQLLVSQSHGHAPAATPPSGGARHHKCRHPLPYGYCWSRGKCKRSSKTCTIRKEGHKEEATQTNKLGGITLHNSRNVKAIADSGANIHLGDAQTPCINLKRTNLGLPAQLPDGSIIRSTHSGILPLTSKLSTEAKTMHIYPELQSGPLLSLGVFANDGCRIILTKKAIEIEKKYQPIVTNPIITGDRNVTTGMWDIDLGQTTSPKQPNQQALPTINNVLTEATKPQLIQYYHAACFSPVQSTWIRAIKRGAFKSWPGLSVKAVQKHSTTKSVSTTLGNMHQTRQGIRSTKHRGDDNLPSPRQEDRTNMVYLAIINPQDPTGHIYTLTYAADSQFYQHKATTTFLFSTTTTTAMQFWHEQ
eukprot:scaffold13447_cov59-Attheya_sp.AAC.3